MTAPGREGARQSRRPLPAARARGPGRALTWAGGRAAGGDRAEAGARPAVAASRQPPVRAAEKAAGQPGERASLQFGAAAAAAATEPTRLPGPASVSAAVLGSPWRRHPRVAATLGAPEVTLRRRPPAVTPREPPIVSSQRRRRRAAGTRGAMSPRARGPGRPFLSLSRRRPRAAHQPPAAPRLSPASPRLESPRVPGRLAHLQSRRRRVRWTPARHRLAPRWGRRAGGRLHVGDPEARRSRAWEKRPEPGRGDLPQHGAPEQSGAGAAAERRT